MRELKRFTESIILVVSVIAFMMFGSAAAAYADDNTFTSYSDAQQYIYQNVMEMNPEIDYTLKLSSIRKNYRFLLMKNHVCEKYIKCTIILVIRDCIF